jgi:hypothetical protein
MQCGTLKKSLIRENSTWKAQMILQGLNNVVMLTIGGQLFL